VAIDEHQSPVIELSRKQGIGVANLGEQTS